jgi:uroporphyrin-III C-methyltransferase
MLPDATGHVFLVGAGPGPVDLLTLRAARLIGEAEALLYDALVSPDVVALAPKGCVRIETGKRSGRHSMGQDEINALIWRLASRGMKVVRLKGGDPGVFGRVGEELDFLRARGIAATVVPGVTAACAAAAQFSFPLTQRGEANRLMLATVRLKNGQVVEDWAGLLSPGTTLALYMGRDSLAMVADSLMAHGLSADTPTAAIENAGYANARLFRSCLGQMSDLLGDESLLGPVVILIGQTTARARELESRADVSFIAQRLEA